MKHVLHAVDDGGPLRAFQDVHDAFETEELGTAMLCERFEKKRQRHGAQGFAAQESVGLDPIMAMMVIVRAGLRPEPRLDIERCAKGIVDAAIEKFAQVDLAMPRDHHRSRRVELFEPAQQRGLRARKVGLGQQQAIRDRGLFRRNLLAVQRGRAVHRIDGGHDAAEDDALGDRGIGHQRLQNRRRIGKPAGLDHEARERSDRAFVAAPQQIVNGRREVIADLAAQASGLQLDQAVLARLDQLVIEADLAELVDDDGGARKLRPAKQVAEQRRLAAAEEAGEDQGLDHVGTSGKAAIRTRRVA